MSIDLNTHLLALRSHFFLRNKEVDARLPNLNISHVEYPEILQYIIWSYKQKQYEETNKKRDGKLDTILPSLG